MPSGSGVSERQVVCGSIQACQGAPVGVVTLAGGLGLLRQPHCPSTLFSSRTSAMACTIRPIRTGSEWPCPAWGTAETW